MRRSVVVLCALLATAALAVPAQAAPTCTWSWSDLPVPAGASWTQVYAAGGHGLFAGTASGRRDEAVLWRDGQLVPLGAAFGAGTRVWDVNADGVVVGSAGGLPVRYRNGQWEHLPVPSGTTGSAQYINDNGDIVGTIGLGRPILWPAAGSYQQIVMPTTAYAEPSGIAEDGTVIIWTNDTGHIGRRIGYLRAPDGTLTLADALAPNTDTTLKALNEETVVGGSDTDMAEWDRSGVVVRTYPSAHATDVNTAGQLLGEYQGSPTIWRDGAIEAQLPGTVGGVLVTNVAIDEDGTVVGQRAWNSPEVTRPVVASCV